MTEIWVVWLRLDVFSRNLGCKPGLFSKKFIYVYWKFVLLVCSSVPRKSRRSFTPAVYMYIINVHEGFTSSHRPCIYVYFLLLTFCRSKSSTQVTAVASAPVAEQEAAVAAAAVPDWVYDPNEPRYCLCNQVSHSSGFWVWADNAQTPCNFLTALFICACSAGSINA